MVDISGYSSPGGREYNEDTVVVWEDEVRQCLIVADGLGGHGGGQTASFVASELLLKAFQETEAVDTVWLGEAYEMANRAVLGQQTPQCQMKTTCVSLFVDKGQALWAHTGDSRLYHFVNGRLTRLTTDHSVSQMAVFSGEITWDQIRFHEDRNRVLRALGTEGPVKPDFDMAALDDGNFHAFLLCSDGFWEYVLEGEMEIDLTKAESADEWIELMVRRLEQRVDGKNDNYTAAAMFYECEGVSED